MIPYSPKTKKIENYIVDYYIPEKKIVIELDGSQHLMRENKTADDIRNKTLSKWGIRVIRIPNKSINDVFNKICNWLLKELKTDCSELK